MRVLIACGGTGGHINPGLAIADIIKSKYPDAEFLFAGTPKGMEAKLVPKAGYKLETIKVAGFPEKDILENIGRNAKACLSCHLGQESKADNRGLQARYRYRYRRLCLQVL